MDVSEGLIYNRGMTANKVFLNKDDIIEIHVVGSQTEASVREMGAALRTLLEELEAQKRPLLVLDDLMQMGETNTGARRAVSDLARTLTYDRVAMLGPDKPLMVYGTQLLLQAIGMGRKIKYFVDREAALVWLTREKL